MIIHKDGVVTFNLVTWLGYLFLFPLLFTHLFDDIVQVSFNFLGLYHRILCQHTETLPSFVTLLHIF